MVAKMAAVSEIVQGGKNLPFFRHALQGEKIVCSRRIGKSVPSVFQKAPEKTFEFIV